MDTFVQVSAVYPDCCSECRLKRFGASRCQCQVSGLGDCEIFPDFREWCFGFEGCLKAEGLSSSDAFWFIRSRVLPPFRRWC